VPLTKPFQNRRRPYPDIKGRPYSFLLMEYSNTLFDKNISRRVNDGNPFLAEGKSESRFSHEFKPP
jgi:hypothetical protein